MKKTLVLLASILFTIQVVGQKRSDWLVKPSIEADVIELIENKGFVIQKDKKYGFMDFKGKVIIPMIYDDIKNVEHIDGWLLVNSGGFNGKYGIIDITGKIIYPVEYSSIAVHKAEKEHKLESLVLWTKKKDEKYKCAFIDKQGKILTETYESIYEPSRGSLLNQYGITRANTPGWDRITPLAKGYWVTENPDGLIEDKTGRVILEGKVNASTGFLSHKDFIGFKKEKTGLMHLSGAVVIPPIYDKIELDNPYAIVSQDGKKGCIDYQNKTGRIVIPVIYDDIRMSRYWNGEAVIRAGNGFIFAKKESKIGLISPEGKNLTPLIYDEISDFIGQRQPNFFRIKKDGKVGILDKRGKEVFPPIYDYINLDTENFIIAQKNGQYGVLNINGKTIVPFQYHLINGYKEGIALVEKDRKWGVMDSLGKILINCSYDELQPYVKGLIRAKRNNKWGIIDKDNQTILPFKYDKLGDWSNKFAITQIGNLYGIINDKGEKITYDIYSSIDNSYGWRDVVKVKQGNQYGLIHFRGEIITPPVYDRIEKTDIDGLFEVTTGGKKGLIDKTGKVLITGYDDISIYPKRQSYAGDNYLNRNGEYVSKFIRYDKDSLVFSITGSNKGGASITGLITKQGEEMIPILYNKIYDFSEGVAKVVKNNGGVERHGFVSYQGKIIAPAIYEEAKDFKEGLAWIKQNGKYGAINHLGKLVIPFTYDEALNFYEGIAACRKGSEENGKWGAINQQGEAIIPFEYDEMYESEEGLITARQGEMYGVIDHQNNIQIPFKYQDIWTDKTYSFLQKDEKWGILKTPTPPQPKKKDKPIVKKEEPVVNLTQNIIWLSPNPDESNNKTYTEPTLEIKFKAFGFADLTKEDYKIYINNELQTVSRSGELSLQGSTFICSITLKEGKNDIQIHIRDKKSKVFTVQYSAKRPNLYILTFAPNYEENTSAETLKFTAKDAEGFINAFNTQQKKGLYNEINIKQLTGKNATAANFRVELESMTNLDINERDIVMIFASSHGSQVGKEFSLKGDNFRTDAPSTTSVPASFIGTQLSKLQCKKLLFIDACYSGGFTGGKDDDEIRAINQTLEALTEAQKFMATFTSSSDNQKSYESDKWQHGAFTKTLLEGLNGNADQNNDRKITLNELNDYLKREVPKLVRKEYKQQQIPNMHLKGVDGDLPIFVW